VACVLPRCVMAQHLMCLPTPAPPSVFPAGRWQLAAPHHLHSVIIQSQVVPTRPPLGLQWVCSLFKRAAYKQQAVENQSIICQIKTQPASWTTAAATFFFTLRAPD
jgi:hypothetical protein